jgi:TorA maturation chaperone TorD
LFWQCLAKVYLPPRDESFFHGLQNEWPRLLGEIADRIGLLFQSDIEEIASDLKKIEDSQELLFIYSRLFLVPPVLAPLNLGSYLDISTFGGSVLSFNTLYQEYGLGLSTVALKDNPDHLARVIEFLGFLSEKNHQEQETGELPESCTGKDLTTLRTRYLLRALPEMIRRTADAETAHQLPSVYSHILTLTLTAIRDPDGLLFDESVAGSTGENGLVVAGAEAAETINCSECGKPIIAAPELQVIADRLRMAGLPIDHLRLCPDCRDAGQGWQSGQLNMDIPGFR